MSEVLVFADWYLPGYRAGGPIRSIARMVEALGDEHRFSIFTRDRDLGDEQPYEGVERDRWLERERWRVFYASDGHQGTRRIRERVREARPDVIYLNSFFSRFTIRVLLLRRLGLIVDVPVVLAPRGEFSPGALGLKAMKKAAYLRSARRLGLCRGLLWHMSTQEEAELVQRRMGPVRHVVASDLPELGSGVPAQLAHRPEKRPGSASFVYLSRIHPMKNLLYAVERLGSVSGDVHLAIFGPVADATYWARCQEAIAGLPANAQAEVRGDVQPDRVIEALAEHHFFILPTLGENFGHVIAEALWARCPVLISDRTPWSDVDRAGAGWALPLEDPDAWAAALRECVAMDQSEFARRSEAALAFIRAYAASPDLLDANRRLFREALGTART